MSDDSIPGVKPSWEPSSGPSRSVLMEPESHGRELEQPFYSHFQSVNDDQTRCPPSGMSLKITLIIDFHTITEARSAELSWNACPRITCDFPIIWSDKPSL
jgi:hypothetical protein